MTLPASDSSSLGGPWRAVLAAGAIGVLFLSVWMLATPLLARDAAWTWRVGEPGALDAATVNAEVRRAGDVAVFAPRPGRAMSVISPPIALDAGGFAAVELDVGCGAGPIETELVWLWQAPGAANFRFTSRRVQLERGLRRFRIELDGERLWRGTIGRIGVQWPGLSAEAAVRQIELIPIAPGARGRTAWRQLAAAETLGPTGMNYLVGPTVLGRGLNRWLMGLTGLVVGGHVLFRVTGGRRPRLLGCVLPLLSAVVAGDAWFTLNVARQTAGDVRAFAGASDPAEALYGEELARCRDLILRATPFGARFCVLSDDPYYPLHRLGYPLLPQRIRLGPERLDQADYIVVFHAGAAVFNDSAGELRWAGRTIPARLVERCGPAAYLLKRGRM